jgi:hypothetical protein
VVKISFLGDFIREILEFLSDNRHAYVFQVLRVYGSLLQRLELVEFEFKLRFRQATCWTLLVAFFA